MAKVTEELPGVEGEGVSPKRIKRLDNAIAQWRDVVEQRMQLTEDEIVKRDKVQAIMTEEGIQKYAYWIEDDLQKDVILDATVKVKMKAHKDAAGASDTDIDDD